MLILVRQVVRKQQLHKGFCSVPSTSHEQRTPCGDIGGSWCQVGCVGVALAVLCCAAVTGCS